MSFLFIGFIRLCGTRVLKSLNFFVDNGIIFWVGLILLEIVKEVLVLFVEDVTVLGVRMVVLGGFARVGG